MNKKAKISAFGAILKDMYPDARCGLDAKEDPYRLLMMAILSAQCTDARVNLISKGLFEKYPDVYSLSECEINELEELVKSCGLYHSKAKNMAACCRRLTDVYGGRIPSDMEDLLSLPGVGRKIANLIRGDVFGLGGIVADTHMIRISNRLGFADSKDAAKVEKALSPSVKTSEQSDFCHRTVLFGRDICRARSPLCDDCPVHKAGLCAGEKKNQK